jgi:hypothetical protein
MFDTTYKNTIRKGKLKICRNNFICTFAQGKSYTTSSC